jgi:anthranilate synthase component 2
MILVIDNYDSFTYNLVHYLQELGEDVVVKRNDALSAEDAIAMRPDAVVLSPGPCTPNEAGICLDLLKKAPADLPILGVCLGHQAMGQAFGGKVVQAKEIMHGKTSLIRNQGGGLFEGLPHAFLATRYHSLAVERDSLPDCFVVDSDTDDGEIMAMHHKDRPIYGVQFHPESIASEHGHALLARFLTLARAAHPAKVQA